MRMMGHSDRPSFITNQRRFNHHGGAEARSPDDNRFAPQTRPRAFEADTYMPRARLRSGRGPDHGPWRQGSAGPLRAGPARALRDLGILLPTAARSLRGPRGSRTARLPGPRRGPRPRGPPPPRPPTRP